MTARSQVQRSDNRILTTHTGSLPRTPGLLAQLFKSERGESVDEVELGREIRLAVEEAVRRQNEVGMSVVNDGEQGKTNFFSYHYHRLTGFERVPALPSHKIHPMHAEALEFPEFFRHRWVAGGSNTEMPKDELCCTATIGWKDFSEVERDIANLKEATRNLDVADVFMTAISPATYVPRNAHYKTYEDYLHAMADAMAREYEAIVKAGFVLQIDAPDLTVYYRQEGVTVEQHLKHMGLCIDVINHATRNLPADQIRVHACWGADEAPHSRDIPLKAILSELLRLRAVGLTLPGANGRHSHEWRVWEGVKLPADKVIVPGVIDSTTNIIEHPEGVAERIQNYVRVLGAERVIAGVDCGFAYNQVDPQIIWAKLRALADGAVLASKALSSSLG
jgi:5-methyltetrahydropteroyltriglutamate--homocysteine methyltransferase